MTILTVEQLVWRLQGLAASWASWPETLPPSFDIDGSFITGLEFGERSCTKELTSLLQEIGGDQPSSELKCTEI